MRTVLAETHSLKQDPGYLRLKDYVVATTGLAYFVDRDTELVEHLRLRMAETASADCQAYLELLQQQPRQKAELDHLVERLTIGETFFFRHTQLFEALRNVVLPSAIERNQYSRRLRIWCAGCSIGAEAYSVAILLRRELASLIPGWQIEIVGTDINRDFLETAQAGCYSDWALRATPDGVRNDCFTHVDDAWRIKPEFREGVSFQHHNLVSHPFPSLVHELFGFDVVLCRNVMIYFAPEIVDRLIDHLYEAVVREGWLLVGHAETNFERFRKFRHVTIDGVTFYQKPPTAPPFTKALPSCLFETKPALETVRKNSPAGQRSRPHRLPKQEQSPGHVEEPRLERVRALADQGQLAEAAELSGHLVTLHPSDPSAVFLHGLILEQQTHYAEAEHWLTRAICLDRRNPLVHYHLGRVKARLGRVAQAAQGYCCTLELLAGAPADQMLAEGDGLTVADLDGLTRMHLDCLETAL